MSATAAASTTPQSTNSWSWIICKTLRAPAALLALFGGAPGGGGWTIERPGATEAPIDPALGHNRHFATQPEWTRRGVTLSGILAAGLAVGFANAYLPHTLLGGQYPGTQALLARFAVGGMVGLGGALLAYSALRSLARPV